MANELKKFHSNVWLLVLLLFTQFLVAPALYPFQKFTYQINSLPQGTQISPAQLGDIRFGYNTRVTDDSSPYPEQVEPTLTIINSGRLLIGWKEADTFNGPGRRVGFCFSDDEGQTFSSNILMETLGPGEFQSDPWLISDFADNAYFAFLEYGGPGEGIGVTKTIDGGSSWQTPTQASDTIGYLDDKETGCIDMYGNIYMMWDHFTTQTSADLVFTKSTNGGSSFLPTQILGPWNTHGGIPYLSCSPNGTLFVSTIWNSNPNGPIDTIFFMKSTDYGTTWTLPQQVNPPGFGEIAIITVCATDSLNNIYICFAAGSLADKEVFVTKSIDGGTSWLQPVQVNDVMTNMQRMVEMHIDSDDNIHVAWLDARNDEWDIFYSFSADGGNTYSQDIRITSEGFPLSFSRPGDYFTLRSGPSGKLYIVWTDGRNLADQDIYFAKQDIAPPVIITYPLEPPFQFQPVTFTVEVTDDDRVAFVDLHYQVDQGSIHHLLLNEISENIYQVTVPGNSISGSILSYYFGANDSAGRYSRFPSEATGFFSVPISTVSPTLLLTIVAAIVVIVVVIIFSVWYLRKD